MFKTILGSILACLAIAAVYAWSEAQPTRSGVILITVDSLRQDAVTRGVREGRLPHLEILLDHSQRYRQTYSHSSATLPAHVSLLSSTLPTVTRCASDTDSVPSNLPWAQEAFKAHGYYTVAAISDPLLNPLLNEAHAGFDVEFLAEKPRSSESTIDDLLRGLAAAPLDQPTFAFLHLSDLRQELTSVRDELPDSIEATLDGRKITLARQADKNAYTRDIRVTPGQHRLSLSTGAAGTGITLSAGSQDVPVQEDDTAVLGLGMTRRFAFLSPSEEPTTCRLRISLEQAVHLVDAREKYDRSLAALDSQLGRLMQELRDRRQYEQSVIVLTGSHGTSLGERGQFGHGTSLFDEQLHVPFLIKLPSTLSMGKKELFDPRAAITISHIDVIPTAMQAAGLPANPRAMGHSISESPTNSALSMLRLEGETLYGRRDETYKLLYHSDQDDFSMYELSLDPSEIHSVYEVQGYVRHDWQEELVSYSKVMQGGAVQKKGTGRRDRPALEASMAPRPPRH